MARIDQLCRSIIMWESYRAIMWVFGLTRFRVYSDRILSVDDILRALWWEGEERCDDFCPRVAAGVSD